MRHALIALGMMVCTATPALAEVNVSIGINLPTYPRLVRVPNYPVYYAPSVDSNYFFYDGLYWDYDGDNWYSSPWYNGPWRLVDPLAVPLYLLRVPVRYYRHPPAYFRGWRADAAPRWGDHWGSTWEQRRSGWNTWNRSSTPAPAPAPTYQRQYSGTRYPTQVEQQATLHTQNYRYQPRDTAVQQQYQQHNIQVAPAPQPAARQRAAPQAQPQPQAQSRAQPQPQAQSRQQPQPQQQQTTRAEAQRVQGKENKGKGQEEDKGKGKDKER
jgi:hypothetical protein